MRDLDQLRRLEPLAEDADFRAEWRRDQARQQGDSLAALIEERTGVIVDPAAIFDVQVKRIHEYKRQHLNILHVIGAVSPAEDRSQVHHGAARVRLRRQGGAGLLPGQAHHPLITAVGRDRQSRSAACATCIKVVFLPNFNVTNGQRIYPAADLSEQISTAGKEASGTGNMKFQMNGALTIGTVDGANIEICEEVGVENFFLFGLEAARGRRAARDGLPARWNTSRTTKNCRPSSHLIRDGFFSRGNSAQFQPLLDNLLWHDPYFVLADYQSYADCQALVDQTYRRQGRLDAHVHPQRRALGKVLLRPHHPRVLRRDLAGRSRCRVQLLSQEEVKAGFLQ